MVGCSWEIIDKANLDRQQLAREAQLTVKIIDGDNIVGELVRVNLNGYLVKGEPNIR